MQSTLQDYYISQGIIYQTLYAYTPQQKGVADRKIIIYLTMLEHLMIYIHVLKYFGLTESLLLVT